MPAAVTRGSPGTRATASQAGVTEVALVQIGPDRQPGFIDWAQEKRLPARRSL
ncbi:MAG TPA: hypothetical protein VFN55_02270 [Solirubrobacteraceae bacterium]|nr:hypothetical protein [Solirubrobacteraceae bacterium]